jgi:hypothetical protein
VEIVEGGSKIEWEGGIGKGELNLIKRIQNSTFKIQKSSLWPQRLWGKNISFEAIVP